jgi:hypothetical protein
MNDRTSQQMRDRAVRRARRLGSVLVGTSVAGSLAVAGWLGLSATQASARPSSTAGSTQTHQARGSGVGGRTAGAARHVRSTAPAGGSGSVSPGSGTTHATTSGS